jgi:DUF4097 and DUF4098 domain-containing protein YvlB
MKSISIALAFTGFVSAAAGETYSAAEKFSQTYPLSANGTVQLSNVNGTVDIVAWDKSEVALEAEKRAPDADALARIHLKIDAGPDRLVVTTEHEKTSWFGHSVRGEVHYQLKVPAGISLEKIAVVNAGITVKGVRGAVRLETVNGGIRATNLAGDARLKTVNGGITAAFDVLAAGQSISADSVNGACELTLPKDAGAQLDLSSVNGGTRCSFPITLEQSGRHRLRGTVGGGGATIKVQTVNGGISVRSN